jgi:hypothetical protein
MSNGKRDYKKELAWEHKNKPNRVKNRAQRNAARAEVAKKKGVKLTAIKGDIGHKKAVSRGGKNSLSNLFVQNPGQNRSFARNKNGSMKSETSKRERRGR